MGFQADWLALRAPADARARDAGLRAEAQSMLSRLPGARIVDLGCGAGASLTTLDAPGARWRLVDNDDALLAAAAEAASAKGLDYEVLSMDLASTGPGLADALADADLVVGSAFLDLVSKAWLDRLVAALPACAAIYFALSYSGEMRWSPGHPQDETVLKAFNEHQRGDKGFGPALGPEAAEALAQRLKRTGWAPSLVRSDWRLTKADDGALIAELFGGIADAAEETGVDVADWRKARTDLQAATISHLDLYAPPQTL